MSETTIVNRTPETFGQKLERERLATVQQEKLEVDRMNSEGPASTETAEFEGSPAWIGPGNKPTEEPVVASSDLLFEELLQRVRDEQAARPHAPRDPDLKEFKDQVIRAFKHLGLDTRKFFGV